MTGGGTATAVSRRGLSEQLRIVSHLVSQTSPRREDFAASAKRPRACIRRHWHDRVPQGPLDSHFVFTCHRRAHNKKVMPKLKSAAVGAAQAIAGAYLVVVLFGVSIKSPGGSFGDVAQEVLRLAAAGTLAFLWWIIPVGAAFGLYAKPAMSRWALGSGVLKAAVLGATLGFITAALYAQIGKDSTPPDTLRTSYVLIPLYCAVWSLLYFGWLHRKLPRSIDSRR